MAFGVEVVNHELGVCEEICLADQAIWTQRAGEIIDDALRSARPTGVNGGEDVVSTLTARNAVEPVANAVRAPGSHYPTCESLFSVLRIVF